MGAILHRQLMRRQFGISQQPSQGFTPEDRRWLQTQGIDRPDQLPRMSRSSPCCRTGCPNDRTRGSPRH
jgi:hypothetical protein